MEKKEGKTGDWDEMDSWSWTKFGSKGANQDGRAEGEPARDEGEGWDLVIGIRLAAGDPVVDERERGDFLLDAHRIDCRRTLFPPGSCSLSQHGERQDRWWVHVADRVPTNSVLRTGEKELLDKTGPAAGASVPSVCYLSKVR